MSSEREVDALKVACVIPTYNGVSDLQRLLGSLQKQNAKFDIIIVDSSSSDGTAEVGQQYSNKFISIPSADFNHGGTRQLMIDRHPEYDIYIFLTQDSYLHDVDSIRNLLLPFANEKVGAVCGRQLPHLDANLLAQHARAFNYPTSSSIKSQSDSARLGIKTPFMSNSFSAYRGTALLAVGGFPRHVILSEDMYVAAKMLLAGWLVAYSGNACCRHSHNYSVLEEFRRYYDQGVFHARENWIRQSFGGAGGEGLKYVMSELRFLGGARVYLWPASLFRNGCKLLGYKLGQKEHIMPPKLKRWLSMHKRFWDHS
ncbi:glycosyltransferase family 2 protein [Pseudomonas juntendi]|uniref:glycosyltransferase family 2 protein n=1 Tax=Pseudomonas TaxID=286 RepID=UPI0034D41BFF